MAMADVRLRCWRLEDAADVAMMGGDPRIRAWSAMEDELDVWIRRQVSEQRGPVRAICRAEEDRAIGRVEVRVDPHVSEAVDFAALAPDERPTGELSYWILPEARGRGLARAGVAAMLELVRTAGELCSVLLDIEVGNVASGRVAQALGAELRHPGRPAVDRLGDTHTMAVWVIALH
jgi:[ribosomal protein S5]-alanine N-acetyltransferase